MDFELTEEQKMLKTMVRELCVKEIEPLAAEIDENCLYPAENIKKLAELGLIGLPFPEEYAGGGGTPVDFALVRFGRRRSAKRINPCKIKKVHLIHTPY